MADNILNTLSMILVVFLSCYVSIIDMVYFIRVKEKFRWIKFIYSIVGAYWCGMYTFFLFNQDIYYKDSSRIFTTIGIILLLFALSYGATVRAYFSGIFEGESNGKH